MDGGGYMTGPPAGGGMYPANKRPHIDNYWGPEMYHGSNGPPGGRGGFGRVGGPGYEGGWYNDRSFGDGGPHGGFMARGRGSKKKKFSRRGKGRGRGGAGAPPPVSVPLGEVKSEEPDEGATTIETRFMPLGPFNEGIPTSFKSAIPSSYHRGLICQQPVTVHQRPVADDAALDIVVVMGQEVEDLEEKADPHGKKKRQHAIIDNRLRSRVNLPAMQFVNRDGSEIKALDSIKNRPLPAKPSRNDFSEDEEADQHDFEPPLADMEKDQFSLEKRLTNTIKDGQVFDKRGALICSDSRIAPVSFLHCHMCDKRGFSCVPSYQKHLQGGMHTTLRRLHVEKLQAGLAYLRAGAKKAEYRLCMGITRSWADPSPRMQSFCDVCGCNVMEFKLHVQLPQHRLVERFIFPECCGQKFRNRVEFEDHRTTPDHLRTLFKERLALTNRLSEGSLRPEEHFQSLPEYLRLLKTNCLVSDDDDNTANLTPYDPDRPNVVKMLKYHGRIQCLCCGSSYSRQQLEALYEHVHSIEHYEAAVQYTTQRERETLKEILSEEKDYPDCVRERCTRVLKIAGALRNNAREAAAGADSSKRHLPRPPPPSSAETPTVLLKDGEPVLDDGEEECDYENKEDGMETNERESIEQRTNSVEAQDEEEVELEYDAEDQQEEFI